MIVDILSIFALQAFGIVGIIFLFGWLISLCNKKFYSNFGSKSRVVCYITGFIGTPIHELSHALFCIIFGHKIREIKLFQVNSDDGTLGYVNHSYNTRNFYQMIGNFFIGIAPILVISILLYTISYFLLPSFSAQIQMLEGNLSSQNFGEILKDIMNVIGTFFSLILTWEWWVFLIIGVFLSIHMTLSGADIKGALGGLIFVLILFIALSVIFVLIGGEVLDWFVFGIVKICSYLLCFLTMALLISLLALAISYLYRLIASKR